MAISKKYGINAGTNLRLTVIAGEQNFTPEVVNFSVNNGEELQIYVISMHTPVSSETVQEAIDKLQLALNHNGDKLTHDVANNIKEIINKLQELYNNYNDLLILIKNDLIKDLDKNIDLLIKDIDKNVDLLIKDLDKNAQLLFEDLDKNTQLIIDELEELNKTFKRIANLLELYPEKVMKETAMDLFASSDFKGDKSADQLADDAIERAGIFTKKLFKALPFTPKTHEYKHKEQ